MQKAARNKGRKREPIPDSFSSIEEAAEFWDSHSIADYWDETREVKNVSVNLARRYFRVDKELASKIDKIARERGVSAETLVNLWLQEKAS